MTHRPVDPLLPFAWADPAGRLQRAEAKKMKFFEKGKVFYEKADYVRGRPRVQERHPDRSEVREAHYMLGMSNLGGGTSVGPTSAFSKAVELNPEHVAGPDPARQALLVGGQPEKAMERPSSVLRADPRNEDALLLKGAAYLAGERIG